MAEPNWLGLGDPEALEGLPLPASPVTASGQDPDEVREQMMAQKALRMGNSSLAGGVSPLNLPAAPAAAPAGPVSTPASNVEPPGFNADVARQSMSGQLEAGRRLAATGDQMTADPNIARLEQARMADEAAAPNASDYKPGFGTRLLRGLKGAALGLAEGGVFGMGAGALDPALVRGGTAYGAPTDAYDTALAANKQKVAADTESLANAQSNFKTAQELRAAQEKADQESGEAFKGAGSTATGQEGEERQTAELPIRQEEAEINKQKVFNEGPEGKLKITQGEIDQRTKLADQQRMPPGFMRTRYILTGEMQPGREPTADEIAVNRILGTWTKTHGGQGPQTVQDWQSIYSAAKGGTGAGGGQADKNLRELASLSEKHLKTLEDQKKAKGYVLLDDKEKAALDQQITDAQQTYDGYRQQLAPPAATAVPAPVAAPGAPPAVRGGGNPPPPPPAPGDMVRMKLPPGPDGRVRYARIPKANVASAKKLGAVEAPGR